MTSGQGLEKVLIVGTEADLSGRMGQLFDRIVYRTPDAERNKTLDLKRDFWLVKDPSPTKLADILKTYKPKAIFAIGEDAFRDLTTYERIIANRGYTFPTPYGPVIGTYDISYLVKGKIHLSRIVQNDILKAVTIARHGVPKRTSRYLLNPTAAEAWRYVEQYEEDITRTLAFDIETPWGTVGEKDEDVWDTQVEDNANYKILRISFSFQEHTAITVPWMEPYISVAKRLLASPGPKTVWNGNFDIPRLEANDAPVEGLVVDAMHAWKALEPALPMGLKFVATLLCHDVEAWRLKSTDEPEYYSAADSDILLRCYLKIRQRLMEGNRWEMFHRHFVQLGQILTKVSRRGVRVDPVAREYAREHLGRIILDLNAQVQPLVGQNLRPRKVFKLPLETLEKKGYKKEDLILVPDQIPALKKGWCLSKEGYLIREPKVVKPKAARKSRKSAKSVSTEATNGG